MGVQSTQSNIPATSLRYSAFLGMLYVSTTETEAFIKEAKAAVGGDAVVKMGFVGDRGNTASAKARKILADKGILPVSITGKYVWAKLKEVEVDNLHIPYISVGLRDSEGFYFINVALGQEVAQRLTRKLVNAKFGVETTINLFAKYEKEDEKERTYAKHGASLVQGEEVPPIDIREKLIPNINAAMEALKAAGVDDKDTLRAQRRAVELKFHAELMKEVEANYSKFYEERDLAEHRDHEQDVPFSADPADEIPF